MKIKKLAVELVSAPEETKTKISNSSFSSDKALGLAFALKDICYEAWTKDPVRAQKAAIVLNSLAGKYKDPRIRAISEWATGIAKITEGKILQSVSRLSKASSIFIGCGDPHLSAHAEVAKLYALALLGRYDEAIASGKRQLKVFNKYGDLLAVGKIHHNLGNIYDRRGLHEEAREHQREARRYFLKVGDEKQVAQVEHSLAITYSALNDFRKAEEFYTRTLARAHSMKMLATEAEIESTLGGHSLLRGRFGEALKYLELSRQKYDLLKMPHQSLTAELEIADAYLELSLLEEAVEIYEKITDKLAVLGMRNEEARSRSNYARALTQLRQFREAREELQKAARLYNEEKNRPAAAFVNLAEAQIEILTKKPLKALGFIKAAENILSKQKSGKYSLLAKWLRGEALRQTKNLAKAEATLAEAAKQKNPQISQASYISLGKLKLERGDISAASNYFKKAINLTERLRDPLPAEEFRMSFLASNIESYEELARINLVRGKIAAAFKFIEQSRSRTLADSLNNSPTGNRHASREMVRLKQQMSELREELNWYYNKLEGNENGDSTILRAIKDKENSISSLIRKSKSIGGAALGKVASLDLNELKKSLGKDRALVEFIGFGDAISAFVVTDTKINYVKDIARFTEIIPLIEGLQFQFGSLRYGAQHLQSILDELKIRADAYLRKLHDAIWAPLADFINERHVVVVPFKELHYVPLHALFDGKSYVIEDREISYAPSATVLQQCLNRQRRKPKNALFLGFGDEKIPHVYAEVRDASKLFENKLVLTKKQANTSILKENAARFDIIHFACHGTFRRDNPMFSALKLYDGMLTSVDISELDLNAGLVALSACETGLNKIFAGDELLGLSRGFFAAGVSSLLLTLWTVNDAASTKLISDFYSNLKQGNGISKALRQAQCNFIKDKQHPYFWSPFYLAGRW